MARVRLESVASRIEPLVAARQIALSSVYDLEVLYSALNVADFASLRHEISAYPHVRLLQPDVERAIDVLELMAARGKHRATGIADLLQAAQAERDDLVVLHYDNGYELIAEITGQPTEWVVPRGSVP
jgi:predicted nucleic acid-binding protein